MKKIMLVALVCVMLICGCSNGSAGSVGSGSAGSSGSAGAYEPLAEQAAAVDSAEDQAALTENIEAALDELDDYEAWNNNDGAGQAEVVAAIEAAEVAEAAETEPPVSDDPYAMLMVSEEFMKDESHRQFVIDACFLKRGDKIYSLDYLPIDQARQWNVGFTLLTMEDIARLSMKPTSDTKGRVMMGEIPIVTVEPDDQLVVYSSSWRAWTLFPVTEVTYTFRHYGSTAGQIVTINPDYSEGCGDHFQLVDANGKEVENINALEHNGQYKLSWVQGSQLRELNVVADAKFLEYDESDRLTAPGEATTEGYAVVDLSGIPAGIYVNQSGAAIEIK